LAAQLLAIYGTGPIVVSNRTGHDHAPLSFGGNQDGSQTHPLQLGPNEQFTPVIGDPAYFGLVLGSSSINTQVESGVVVPGGRVVELNLHANRAGNVVFHLVILPGNSISIDGSVPIQLHFGLNYITVYVIETVTVAGNHRQHGNKVVKRYVQKVLAVNIAKPVVPNVPLTGNIFYDYIQSKLSGSQRAQIKTIANSIVAKGYTKVTLVGYANLGDSGTHPAAVLSQFRAYNVYKELVKDLKARGDLHTKVTYRGAGGTNKFGSEKTEDGRSKNRTVVYTATR
jgi:outer membrane protein OmpA-like peptidoglycan-associated protein